MIKLITSSKLLILYAFLSLNSCYEDPHLSMDIENNPSINADSSIVSFFIFSQVYRPARGIKSFPDGGQPKIIFKNVSLWQYNLPDNDLIHVFDFGDIPYNKSRWECTAHYKEDTLLFRIKPVSGWDFEIGLGGKIDSVLYTKYRYWFRLHPDQEVPEKLLSADNSQYVSKPYPVRLVKNLMEEYPYSNKGIRIERIMHLSEKQFRKQLENGEGKKQYLEAVRQYLSKK